ncbi:MAG: YigZ family protein [Oscillospiraceae bacterium]|nr:YigZ family protein [Oscillospiraceae bacterium]
MTNYLTVPAAGEAELIEKKSRFIGHISPVSTLECANSFLEEIRSKHKKANHNCFGFILREGGVERMSDDGEPKGTAGPPILEVIRRENITDVAIVVTRYFGGVMLGAGGLIRAYAGSAKLAIDKVGIAEMCLCHDLVLSIPYPLYEQVAKLIESHPVQVLGTDFASDVAMNIRLRVEEVAKIEIALSELSAGKIKPQLQGELFAPVSVGF